VLVVDDDADMLALCELYLSSAGFAVASAASGASALALAGADHPAVILLDFMLPDMDGTEVLQALQADDATAGIPVIMLTARVDVRDEQAAWEIGVFDYMTKPFQRDRLLAVVRAASDPSGQEEAERRRNSALQRLRFRDVEAWQRLAAVLDNCDEAVIVIDKTGEGTITGWNPGAERLFGYRTDEAVGQPLSMLAPPDRLQVVADVVQRVARGERIEGVDAVRQHRDGHQLEVSLTIVPLRDRSGWITGATLIARDMAGIRQADARLAALFETAPEAILIVDDRGTIEQVNRQTELMFGYGRAELLGQPVTMLMPARQRGASRERREQFFAAPDVRPMGSQGDLYGLRKDGTEFPVEVGLSPLEIDGHLSATATVRDVTQYRRAEAMFRGLLESAPDAVLIIGGDGIIELVNRRAETLFGYDRTELVGQPVEMLVPPRLRRAHVAHRAKYMADPRVRPLDTGREFWGLRRDGTEVPLEIALSPFETGGRTTYTTTIREMSEHRRAELMFRGLVESAADALVIVGGDGRIQLVNAQTEKLFGYDRGELVGQPVEILVPQRSRAHHAQDRGRYSKAPRLRPMGAGLDLYGVRKDGSEFPVEISLSPLEQSDGLVISAAIRDVTDRKLVEQAQRVALQREREASGRLRELDRLRDDFLSSVSHELRTPLAAIQGFTDILTADLAAEPGAEKWLEIATRIGRAAGRLDHLMSDLLDFIYLERGQLAVRLGPESVAKLVTVALNRAGPTVEGHEITVAVADDLGVMADPAALTRVLEQLVANAAKFSPAGSTIAVAAEQEDGMVAISVSDEGPGVAEGEANKIFDRFYRAGPDSRRSGTGIGLAIVKEFTEAQHGWVEVDSVEGAGSTFTVHLPRADPRP